MSRYFFDVINGSHEADAVGSHFASLDAARGAAVKFAGAMLRDNGELVWDGQDLRVEMLDAARLPLFAVVVTATNLFPAT